MNDTDINVDTLLRNVWAWYPETFYPDLVELGFRAAMHLDVERSSRSYLVLGSYLDAMVEQAWESMTCEHGLSATWCAGPMHYPTDF